LIYSSFGDHLTKLLQIKLMIFRFHLVPLFSNILKYSEHLRYQQLARDFKISFVDKMKLSAKNTSGKTNIMWLCRRLVPHSLLSSLSSHLFRNSV
jgi:hypothetical protein